MIEPLEINGCPPELAGMICEELLCQQYWYRGALADEANITFLRFGNIWHRLYFDCGIIFWRTQLEAPTSYDAPEIEATYPLVDVGAQRKVRGQQMLRFEMRAIEGGSQVEFLFVEGQSLVFNNVWDRTSLAA